jgi:hypothetical protein
LNRTEHLLTIAAEECAEVAQRIAKALRFGLHEIQPGQTLTNAQRIMAEYHDLQAVIEMLQDDGSLPKKYSLAQIMAKMAKVEHYLKLSAECGTLDACVDRTGERAS